MASDERECSSQQPTTNGWVAFFLEGDRDGSLPRGFRFNQVRASRTAPLPPLPASPGITPIIVSSSVLPTTTSTASARLCDKRTRTRAEAVARAVGPWKPKAAERCGG